MARGARNENKTRMRQLAVLVLACCAHASHPDRAPLEMSYYEFLGVSSTASVDEIKKSYRSLALKFHPDKVSSLGPEDQAAAEEKFLIAAEASECLCSPESRERYDKLLALGVSYEYRSPSFHIGRLLPLLDVFLSLM